MEEKIEKFVDVNEEKEEQEKKFASVKRRKRKVGEKRINR